MRICMLLLVVGTYTCVAALFKPKSTPKQVCYGNLGCFYTNKEFGVNRTLHVTPESPEDINTRFALFNKARKTDPAFVIYPNIGTIKQSLFNPNKLTVIICHGFIEKGFQSKWMKNMKDSYLERMDINVILVDWSGGNRGHGLLPNYPQATANTRVVGAVIARLVRWIEKHTGAGRNNFHLIGHSLGAHVCGYAGYRLRENTKQLGRITGLDPADPYFQYTHTRVRLNSGDAALVDVIHTDGESVAKGIVTFTGGFGVMQPAGHLDFYPNGGASQPGCAKLVIFRKKFIACDHSRAHELYIQSIKHPNKFQAFGCQSYNQFLKGQCLKCSAEFGCPMMGLNADKYKGILNQKNQKFYMMTLNKAPFLAYEYFVKIKLSKNNKKSYHGSIQIIFSNSTDKVFFTSKTLTLKPSTNINQMFTSTTNLLKVKRLQLKWTKSGFLSGWFSAKKIELESISLFTLYEQKWYQFRINPASIVSKKYVTFIAH